MHTHIKEGAAGVPGPPWQQDTWEILAARRPFAPTSRRNLSKGAVQNLPQV